jgi:alkanesulfonate monooxygenase SsuD/methylene tetrahydromethanopterin reductase-like flavin-dependent oxidoreductase (luciferase family)
VLVADTTEEARAIATPALDWLAATSAKAGNSAVGGSYAKGYEYYEQLDKIRRERAEFKWTDDAWASLETTPIVGDPEEVARRLSAVQSALDLGSFMSWSGFGGIPHEKVMRSMELFAREVMPRFRSVTSSGAVPAGANV